MDHAAALVQAELQGEPASQARLLFKIGDVYNALGEYGAAIEAVKGALKLRRDLYGSDSLQAADALSTLGLSQHYAGRYDEAEASFLEAPGSLRARSGPSSGDTVSTMIEFGDLLHTRGRLVEAEQMLREAVAALRATGPVPGHEALARALLYLANVLRDRGSFDEAAALFREAVDTFSRLHGQQNQQVAVSQSYFARLLVMRSDFASAEKLLDDALRVLRDTYEGNHPLVGTALRELGHLRLRTEQGRFTEAGSILNESIRIHQRLLGSHHSLVPRTRAHQAELARRRGALSEAVSAARQTVDEFVRIGLSDHPSAIDARATLGEALTAIGKSSSGRARAPRGAFGRRAALRFRRSPHRPAAGGPQTRVASRQTLAGRSGSRTHGRTTIGTLRNDHNAIGAARHDCRIVCAKPINRDEAARSQVKVDFVSQPAAHDERVVVRTLHLTVVKRVPFGDEEAPVLAIQLRETRERQLSTFSRDAFPEEWFASFAESGGLPLSDVENEHPRGSKRPRKGNEDVLSVGIGDEIIENAPAKDRVVATGRQSQNVANAERRWARTRSSGAPGFDQELGRRVDPVDVVAATRKLNRIATASASSVQ